MRIIIWVTDHQPASGRVHVDDNAPQPFVGLLGLLRILSDALAAAPTPAGTPTGDPDVDRPD